jgi:type III secretion protein R
MFLKAGVVPTHGHDADPLMGELSTASSECCTELPNFVAAVLHGGYGRVLMSPLHPFLLADAAGGAAANAAAPNGSGLAFWLVLLVVMALAPFVLTMVTSFAKLVIVGGILRTALGTPQIPPNTVITGLALILTVHIMSPVAMRIYNAYQAQPADPNANTSAMIHKVATAAELPMREFLQQHSHADHLQLFDDLQARLSEGGGEKAKVPEMDPLAKQGIHDAVVLTPAFMLSQLTEAFQIGFLLFVPFLVIDLVVSNVLMAMGMQMLSPTTVSLPLKLLLFVLIDGWTLVMRGLVLSYT